MFFWIVCAGILLGLLIRYPYFLQDVQHTITAAKVRRRLSKYVEKNHTILNCFLDAVKTHPHKPFIRFNDETHSYRDADIQSNKVARALLQSGLVKQDDTVALFFGNEPFFIWCWLGLFKIGCPAAFLNYNLRSKSLLHCFKCTGAQILIAAEELQDAVEEILPSLLEQNVTVFIMADNCKTSGMESFKDKINQASCEPIPSGVKSNLTLLSPAVYIYTSGTTGLPKAAIINHRRVLGLSLILSTVGVKSDDVIYTSLPLYHSAGFIGCTGAIERGSTVVLKSKFSTSSFWEDCRKFDVTVIQYIGETMRYLCNTPKKHNDRSHKVRIAIGNGVRPNVWRDFINRFGNVQIKELYGATEGNVYFVNYTGKIGAIGRQNFFHKMFFPYALIKYDAEKEEPLRDSSGFCLEVAKGESGLLVSQITQKAPFVGYARDLQQTQKKKLDNVFKKGDMYFNTGDLLRVDEDNFIYFQDRMGDTYRWKGENVATNEVSDIITGADCIEEANVYGVNVPGQEGRAGMAAVILRDGEKFDCRGIFKHVENLLPTYARPRFIRIQNSLEVTGTFKQLKVKLVEQGFNPNEITDPLYFLDEMERNYVPLTQDIFTSVISGKCKI